MALPISWFHHSVSKFHFLSSKCFISITVCNAVVEADEGSASHTTSVWLDEEWSRQQEEIPVSHVIHSAWPDEHGAVWLRPYISQQGRSGTAAHAWKWCRKLKDQKKVNDSLVRCQPLYSDRSSAVQHCRGTLMLVSPIDCFIPLRILQWQAIRWTSMWECV